MTHQDSFPFDPPIASSANGLRPPELVAKGPASAGNTPRETRTRSASERISRQALQQLAGDLSDRDCAVLRSIAAHRFLATNHLQHLHFTTHASPASASRSCRLVMQRLEKLKLVRSLERRVGGIRAGSAAYVWTTGWVGRRLLTLESAERPRRHAEPSERFLAHALAIADVHLSLITAHREGRLELLSVQLEPECWRPFTGSGGQRAVLQPDLAVTTGAGDYEDAWFVEVDLGTEHLPTLIRKCQQYEIYRRTGIEQDRFGSFPWVIWLLPSQHRVNQFRAAIERTRTIDAGLFQVITPDGLLPLITNINSTERR